MGFIRWGTCWSWTFAVLWGVLPGWFCGSGGQSAQADANVQWTWMKGSNTVGQYGNYGTFREPSLTNTPGARCGAVSWNGSSGALWLFGGIGFDSSSGHDGFLNDLWKYDTTTGSWTWMKGANAINPPGVYGTPGAEAETNIPPGRQAANTWTDSLGKLWLFGGSGNNPSGSYMNDLWNYNPVSGNWIWVKGSSAPNQVGGYGTPGVEAESNCPGARHAAASWTDSTGMFWLFGGYGYGGTGGLVNLNDLWRYNPATGYWAWMGGSSTGNQMGIYGTRLTESASNMPGARFGAISWTDPVGELWLFGGSGYGSSGGTGLLNDLWKYDPATGHWTWMKGSSAIGASGVYGTPGTAAETNTPGGRDLSSCGWSDASGAFWLFGGYGYDSPGSLGYLNDVWKYDRSTGDWAWMKGGSTMGNSGVYGAPGTAALANTPGSRLGATAWQGSSGNLWMFGGWAYDSTGAAYYCNDLWRMTLPDTTPPTGSVVINGGRSVTNNAEVTLSLMWSDGTGSGVVRMRFSNDGSTWTAWEPLAPTKPWTLAAGDGYRTVRVMYRDAGGNNSRAYNDFIRVDTIAPTGSILINEGALSTNNRKVSLGLKWNDGTGSGVTRMRFSIDGATWSVWEALSTPRFYTLPATPGYYTVRVQYLDAGNNYSAVYNDYIRLVAP